MMWLLFALLGVAAFFTLVQSIDLHDHHPEGATPYAIAVRKERSRWLAGLAMAMFLGASICLGLA